MKKELDQKLTQAFPNLYNDRNGNVKDTCMAWGFECGPGWFQLLYDLSYKLENLIVRYKKENPTDEHYPRAAQVKEKYGTLRFYMVNSTDEMDLLIMEAERLSAVTCEYCGNIGKTIQEHNWYMTVCLLCRIKVKINRHYRYIKWEVDYWIRRFRGGYR